MCPDAAVCGHMRLARFVSTTMKQKDCGNYQDLFSWQLDPGPKQLSATHPLPKIALFGACKTSQSILPITLITTVREFELEYHRVGPSMYGKVCAHGSLRPKRNRPQNLSAGYKGCFHLPCRNCVSCGLVVFATMKRLAYRPDWSRWVRSSELSDRLT